MEFEEARTRTGNERNKNGYRGVMKIISKHTGRVYYKARIVRKVAYNEKSQQFVSRSFDTPEEAYEAYKALSIEHPPERFIN